MEKYRSSEGRELTIPYKGDFKQYCIRLFGWYS